MWQLSLLGPVLTVCPKYYPLALSFLLYLFRNEYIFPSLWSGSICPLPLFGMQTYLCWFLPSLIAAWKWHPFSLSHEISKSQSSLDRSRYSPAPLESVKMSIFTELGLFSMSCSRDVTLYCHCVHGCVTWPPWRLSVLSVFHNLFGSGKSWKVTI